MQRAGPSGEHHPTVWPVENSSQRKILLTVAGYYSASRKGSRYSQRAGPCPDQRRCPPRPEPGSIPPPMGDLSGRENGAVTRPRPQHRRAAGTHH
jgi:hypothetical protein